MHIDTHAHIFTLRTVLSLEAVRSMTQRLRDHNVPGLIVDGVERFLDGLLDKPENLDECQLLARLLGTLKQAAGFDKFLAENLARLPFNVAIRGDGLEDLEIHALRKALDELTSALAGGKKVGKGAFDIIDTIRMTTRSTITAVADEFLGQMDPDDVLVALMMDIRAPDEPERDRQNFLRQIAGTREAALQRPGRVLPFFAIHPERPKHFELMRKSIEEGSFVGIKLYPSLGYEVSHPNLLKVYDYCLEQDLPILLHCGDSGFFRRRGFIDYGDPHNWRPVLKGNRAKLRICFGHFGGWKTLGAPGGRDPGTWGATILEFIRDRNLPNVYTDLAYHVDQMASEEDERRYFGELAKLLQEPGVQDRILFGSDCWLLRMDMTAGVYWKYFRDKLSSADFDRIATLAPRLFLGFPQAAGGALRPNLARHVDFLAQHRSEVGADPASWVLEAAGGTFEAKRDRADWDQWSHAVRCTYRECSQWMTSAQKRAGYRAHRTTELRELTYFRPRDPNFDLTVDGIAMNLVGRAEDMKGASYASAWNREAAVRRLKKVFKRGDLALVEVAGLLDSMFDFKRGLV
jgi:predicted TIM-barrel fold metal-dependent hydrolase